MLHERRFLRWFLGSALVASLSECDSSSVRFLIFSRRQRVEYYNFMNINYDSKLPGGFYASANYFSWRSSDVQKAPADVHGTKPFHRQCRQLVPFCLSDIMWASIGWTRLDSRYLCTSSRVERYPKDMHIIIICRSMERRVHRTVSHLEVHWTPSHSIPTL